MSSLLIGAAHAFEADHLAAMGSLAAERSGWKKIALRGALWGLGHTLTLFALSMAVIAFGMSLSEEASAMLELFVGIMLIGLGFQLLIRAFGIRIHRHEHVHNLDGTHNHIHLHLNREHEHNSQKHIQMHRVMIDWKPMAVGMIHGAAGSGALIVMVAAVTADAFTAGLYVLCFGIGSIAGMVLASIAASMPLSLLAKATHRGLMALKLAIALFTTAIGISILTTNMAMS
jgi:sulfite exporter TauE/SafE